MGCSIKLMPNSLKLLFLGDLCLSGSQVPDISQSMQELFNSADFVCLNCEAPIVGSGIRVSPKAGPSIRQSDSALRLIRACNGTHVNLANNHIMDFGLEGLQSTLDRLNGLQHLGAGLSAEEAYRACRLKQNGHHIALLAFGEAQFGVLNDEANEKKAGFAWVDHPRARKAILDARRDTDWVLVQVHAGLEMVDIPLPEWRARYRELIDLGADMVIGHHPHVIQGTERYKGKSIHYSLGNFYMDVMLGQPDQGSGGVLKVTIDDKGLSSRMIPLRVTLERIELDESEESERRYQMLCEKLLNDQAYQAEIQKVCDSFWLDIYSKYYESALFGLGTEPNLSAAKRVLRRLLGRLGKGRRGSQANELMLLHNIRIETHRWVVERALAKRIFQ